MLERERLATKKLSKTQSVMSQFEVPLTADDIHVGPSDHVPWLTDRKMAYIRLEGTAFGSLPINLELKLDVWDSPNSAGVVIDAVRCARLAMDRGLGGALLGPSSYVMKSPPRQFTDGEARARTIEFIHGDGRRAGLGEERPGRSLRAACSRAFRAWRKPIRAGASPSLPMRSRHGPQSCTTVECRSANSRRLRSIPARPRRLSSTESGAPSFPDTDMPRQ